jgi:hypothetical protein
VFASVRRSDQGLSTNALKALGLVLFLPTLTFISIQREDFQSDALAALLGTVAGYVLSRSKGTDA